MSRSRLPFVAFTFAIVLILLVGAGSAVAADAGPKPSLTVVVRGETSADDYLLDLLVPQDAGGIRMDETSDYLKEHPELQSEPIVSYVAPDGRVGYVCHGFMTRGALVGTRRNDGSFEHGYGYIFVPKTFAVVVQDRATGAITVSNTVTTTQFDALVVYDAGTNAVTVLRNTRSFWWWLKLLIRIFLTTFLECVLVFAFRFPRRRWLPIPVNLATQGLLNLVVLVALPGLFMADYVLWFAVFEVLVFVLEFLAYFFWMGERRFWKPFLYALSANAATLAVGLWWLS
jgi:hypothetical protein